MPSSQVLSMLLISSILKWSANKMWYNHLKHTDTQLAGTHRGTTFAASQTWKPAGCWAALEWLYGTPRCPSSSGASSWRVDLNERKRDRFPSTTSPQIITTRHATTTKTDTRIFVSEKVLQKMLQSIYTYMYIYACTCGWNEMVTEVTLVHMYIRWLGGARATATHTCLQGLPEIPSPRQRTTHYWINNWMS